MKKIMLFLTLLGIYLPVLGQIILSVDYDNSASARNPMHYHYDIYNRINPVYGFNMPARTDNAKLCIVRPLGGISRRGEAQPDLCTYKWDGTKFYTDFSLLKKQIDGVYSKGIGIYQIVLDNPSWAFQRAVDGSLPDGSLKVSTYGNAEPPRDYKVWANYLKDVMKFLIDTYGKDEMQKVQFCIGREIGTEGHWSGTPEQFYEFYRISINAVREVLPTAKVGSHFLWATSRHSWGPDFVRWCKANNVHYDFIGVSFYPFYHQIGRVDLDSVYIKDFAPIKDIPEWNKNAKLEMHEFALIKSMGEAGNTFESAPNEHQNAFTVMLMKMFYENDMHNLFQWGNGANIAPATREFLSMKGNTYYTSTKSGTPKDTGNMIDALFSRELPHNQYNIMAYNYNANPTSATSEQVVINATIGTPPGTRLKYRLAIYHKSDNTLPWSDWQSGTTKGNLSDKSTISFYVSIPVFSFLKYEIMILL